MRHSELYIEGKRMHKACFRFIAVKWTQRIILSAALLILFSGTAASEIKNERTIGLLLGDPMAISLKAPVTETTFLNIQAGVWSWSFWHGIDYNTPYLSVDYAWLFPIKQTDLFYYIGAGVGLFFADNPKDKNNYDASADIRFPFGLEFYAKDNFSMAFEIAPIYQVLPHYTRHYIFELNGGLILSFSY